MTTSTAPLAAPGLVRVVEAGIERARGLPLLSPLATAEVVRERLGGHPVADHRPHLEAALAWLCRAQDATSTGGVSRGYHLVWDPHFRTRGWQAAYPETTGYIIPTLFLAARHLARPDLAERAERAARWEAEIQLASGAVRGGIMSQPAAPAVFNTGQVLLGWLAAFRETGSGVFAACARAAAAYLVAVLDPDGLWRRGNSRFADPDATLYNARVAWALAEAGARLDEPDFKSAAERNLRAVAALQRANGWFPQCCLTDAERPLLHTLAYTIRGLLEGGRVLEHEGYIAHAARAADRIAQSVRSNGWLPGRFTPDWGGATRWSCLTGNAQMANIWLRLFEITGERKWLEPVPVVLRFIKATQNRSSPDPGLRGGIKGSFPLGGDYGRYQVLNWATKFFADALMRDERLRARVPEDAGDPGVLA